jgi:hypothetical protein
MFMRSSLSMSSQRSAGSMSSSGYALALVVQACASACACHLPRQHHADRVSAPDATNCVMQTRHVQTRYGLLYIICASLAHGTVCLADSRRRWQSDMKRCAHRAVSLDAQRPMPYQGTSNIDMRSYHLES